MKIVVDTNIVFSGILNSNGKIGDLLFNSPKLEFYSCGYRRYEIQKHWDKLKKISGLTDNQLQISYTHIMARIRFINEELIPAEIWRESEILISSIDPDDIDFVALTTFLKATLWTGDKLLYQGLKAAHFSEVMNTADLLVARS